MKLFLTLLILPVLLACNKKVEVQLPAYDSQMVIEMYLEEGKPLRCMLSESLPYTDANINSPLSDAVVVLSDGLHNDTLIHDRVDDWEAGRWYNYSHHRRFKPNPEKVYTLRISDTRNRRIEGTTSFSQGKVNIDSIAVKPVPGNEGKYKVGVLMTDPPGIANQYRFLITKGLTDFSSEITDFTTTDESFNGRSFSFFSEETYARGDTVMVRLYTLHPDHYNYIKSTGDARVANFNPFVQPALVRSSIDGGLGIFCTVSYDQRNVVIR